MKNPKKKSTWSTQPATNKWNTATNWDPAAVPTDKANFSKSSQSTITFSPTGAAKVETIEFDAGAPPYSLMFGSSANPSLTISGKGVINKSGKTQSLIVASTGASFKNPQLKFTNAATAGGNDMAYAAGPESLENGYGGGIIGFCDKSTAGSASFVVRTGALAPPKNKPSTVGAEVSFSDSSTAATARFTIYGSLGTDGDTFGNTVFHDKATADHATFTNIGGTVSGGDGGNTQFYNNSSAAHGIYNNYGGTFNKANGGDVAFDGNADGGHGHFLNRVATVTGANGGVTSFNNNPPDMKGLGASAGHGLYQNYGATKAGQGGGGHTEFTAKHGSPTAGNAHFINHGSAIAYKSSAGHTIFSINLPTKYYPTAGSGIFWNHPASSKNGAAGFTEFSVYGTGKGSSHVPTAAEGTFINLGAYIKGASGGYTVFSGKTTAGNAKLVAHGGTHGGYGGQIIFYDQSSGGSANVQLFGNGELNISDHTKGLTIGDLELNGGLITTQLGINTTTLKVSGKLVLKSTHAIFSFRTQDNGGFKLNTSYTILSAPNLSKFKADRFSGNSLNGVKPVFTIVGNNLKVTFKS